jgi:signal peptidase I
MYKNKRENEQNWASEIRFFLLMVFVIFLFRLFAFEPFYIPSASMESTLQEGDYIFVSKYRYGYSGYSIPFFHIKSSNERFAQYTKPARGDIIVFYKGEKHYIKRLVGLPGDSIDVKNGQLWINNQPVPKFYAGTVITNHENKKTKVEARRYIEKLPNGFMHYVLDHGVSNWDNVGGYKVPEGHYFFMGDNRDNSADSRTDDMGYIAEANIVGRAELIFFSSGEPLWKIWALPRAINWDRLFNKMYDNVSTD